MLWPTFFLTLFSSHLKLLHSYYLHYRHYQIPRETTLTEGNWLIFTKVIKLKSLMVRFFSFVLHLAEYFIIGIGYKTIFKFSSDRDEIPNHVIIF